MLTPSRSRRVFAYQKHCDMRKQYDSLAALVSEAMSRAIISMVICFCSSVARELAQRFCTLTERGCACSRSVLTEDDLLHPGMGKQR